MQVGEDSEKTTLDQRTNIESVIEKFSTQGSSKMPAQNKRRFPQATKDEQLLEETLFKNPFRSFLYTAKKTRPDIVLIVNVIKD